MRRKELDHLIESDEIAKDYFYSLPEETQIALLEYGDGVNTVEELKHFSEIIEERGGR